MNVRLKMILDKSARDVQLSRSMTEKPHLARVTLVVVDTGDKKILGARAMEKCLEQTTFGAVKFLTDDLSYPHAVKIRKLKDIEDYSNFVIRELWQHVDTTHVLIAQWDGHTTNGAAWTDAFLDYDYIGAPWEGNGGVVGNGGYSLRSRRFLEIASRMEPGVSAHPEDAFCSYKHRQTFEAMGLKFAPTALARRFAFEGRKYSGVEWGSDGRPYNSAFGFHSYLSKLPDSVDAPLVYHHSGDAGDLVYSLATAKALGGGTYFLSAHCLHPYPKAPKCCADGMAFWENCAPLVRRQSYIWNCQPTTHTPDSAAVDFNAFRRAYQRGGLQNWMSLLALHGMPFGVDFPRDAIVEPWLECDDPVVVPDRPIVVSNTGRYLNMDFPWWSLCRRYGSQMVFIGTEHEHALFQALVPDIPIPHNRTANLWEVAGVIQGAKCCVMNQSAPLAIAHGLGKRVLVSEWPANANCHLNRGADAVYFKDGPPPTGLPEGWV